MKKGGVLYRCLEKAAVLDEERSFLGEEYLEALVDSHLRFLRGIRVRSRSELERRIEQYLEEVNAEPVVFRWKYQVEDARV